MIFASAVCCVFCVHTAWCVFCVHTGSVLLTEPLKAHQLNLQDVSCLLSQVFLLEAQLEAPGFLWSSCSGCEVNPTQSCPWSLCLPGLQPPTWAATGARSRTCWIKASRSARSASSSRQTIDSSCCAASGTRASGFIPLTLVTLTSL